MAKPIYTVQDRIISRDGVPVLQYAVPRKPQDQGGGWYVPPHEVDAIARRIVGLLNAWSGDPAR